MTTRIRLDLKAINERLDEPHGYECGRTCLKLAHEDAPLLTGEVERLRATLDLVRTAHPCRTDNVGPIPGATMNPWCGTCQTNYPCPTIQAIEAA